LTRYFRHALFRKDLLLSESVRAGHRFLLTHFALVNWYIVGLAVADGRTTATIEDFREALHNVEKYYAHHTTYTRFLETQPVVGTLVDSAIHTTRFPAAMV